MSNLDWDAAHSDSLYQVDSWGGGYFTVNDQGHVEAITGGENGVDLKQLCDDLAERDLRPPLLLRFPTC